MALCRWSDYRCDLYIYESDWGIECHVAWRRRLGEPEPPLIPVGGDDEAWQVWHKAFVVYEEQLLAAPLERIGLPHDGESRTFGEWGELLAYVTGLKGLGYGVPDWVIEEIKEEVGATGLLESEE